MPRPRTGKCPKCQQVTPLRSGNCLYCGGLLDGAIIVDDGSDEAPVPKQKLEEPRLRGGTPRFQRMTDAKGHFLVTPAGEPVPLEPGRLFVIGRDARSSLVVRAADVSRKHAEIDWRGDPPRPVVIEVRSRHGTFVNGAPVRRDAPEGLRDGDEVRLGGSFTLTYRHATEHGLREVLEEKAREETRELRLPTKQVPAPAPAPAPFTTPGVLTPEVAAALGLPPNVNVAALAAALGATPAPPGYPVPGYAPPAFPGYPVPPAPAYPPQPALPPEFANLPPELLASMGLVLPQHAPPVRPTAMVPVPPPAPVAVPDEGDLAAIPGGALLEALHRERRTGTLTIYCSAGQGDVVLVEGRAKKATLGPRTGREALEAIAQTTQGAYRFKADANGARAAVADDWADSPSRPATERPIPPELLGIRPDSFGGVAASIAARTGGVLPLKPAGDPGGPAPPLRDPEPDDPYRGEPEPLRTGIVRAEPPRGDTPGSSPRAPEDPRRPRTGTTRAPTPSDRVPVAKAPGGNPLKPPTQAVRPQARPGSSALRPPTEQIRPATRPTGPGGPRPPSSPGGNPPRAKTSERVAALDPEVEAAATTLLATIKAAGLSGEALGQFVGDAVTKLIDQGLVAVAVEVGDRGLKLSEADDFEAAIAARIAFKQIFRGPDLMARIQALLEAGAITNGRPWAAALAARALALVDPEVPPDPSHPSPLGRIAALARAR